MEIQVHFKFPKKGWICINVDGACKNGVIGCGGVIHGDVGEWISRFAKFIGRGEPYMAELWGLYKGMKLAKQLRFDKVELRVDSTLVVQDVQRKKNIQRHGNNLLSKILSLFESNWKVNIKHIHREANQLTDAMANYSFALKDEYKEFVDCPREFLNVFTADLNDIGVSRVIEL